MDTTSQQDRRLYRFGLFEADLEQGTLSRQGTPVKLQEQPFRILALLLEAEFARKPYEGRLDKLLTEPQSPAMRQLLAKIDHSLMAAVFGAIRIRCACISCQHSARSSWRI